MSYFNKFPIVPYDFFTSAHTKIDFPLLSRRLRVKESIIDNISYYNKYNMVSGERADVIADKIYGNPEFHWVLYLMNRAENPYYDWYLSDTDILEYAKEKYGASNIHEVHHYEDENGYVVMSNHPNAVAVTNLEFEEKANEENIEIKILVPQFLQSFISEFNKRVKS